jgi:hypothetical protein
MARNFTRVELLKIIISTLRAWIVLAFVLPATLYADSYLIRVKSGGIALASVEIYGNSGFNQRVNRSTDINGEFTLNTAGLTSPNPELVFTKSGGVAGGGYRFEPAELTLSSTTCPGNICTVLGFRDGPESAVLQWTVKNVAGQNLSGMQVVVSNGPNPCPKTTDANGYVLWAVKHRLPLAMILTQALPITTTQLFLLISWRRCI